MILGTVPSLRDLVLGDTPYRGLKPTVNKVSCLRHLMMHRDSFSQHRRCDTSSSRDDTLSRRDITSFGSGGIRCRRDSTSSSYRGDTQSRRDITSFGSGGIRCHRDSTSSSYRDSTLSRRDGIQPRSDGILSRRDITLLTGGFNPRTGITSPVQSRRDGTSASSD